MQMAPSADINVLHLQAELQQVGEGEPGEQQRHRQVPAADGDEEEEREGSREQGGKSNDK